MTFEHRVFRARRSPPALTRPPLLSTVYQCSHANAFCAISLFCFDFLMRVFVTFHYFHIGFNLFYLIWCTVAETVGNFVRNIIVIILNCFIILSSSRRAPAS